MAAAAAAPRLRFNRWVYYVGALIHLLGCAGAIFGWANMSLILRREGAFASACGTAPTGDPAKSGSCAESALRLSGVYSAASVCAFVIPAFSGPFQDRYGPRTTIRILSLVFAAGVLLVLAAVHHGVDDLYYPGFAAIGTASSANILPLYSAATLFPANKALALSVLSGAFDAGTIVFFVFARLYDAGWPLSRILIGYLAGPVAAQLLMSVFLWPEKSFDSYGVSEGKDAAAAVSGDGDTAKPAKHADSSAATSNSTIAERESGTIPSSSSRGLTIRDVRSVRDNRVDVGTCNPDDLDYDRPSVVDAMSDAMGVSPKFRSRKGDFYSRVELAAEADDAEDAISMSEPAAEQKEPAVAAGKEQQQGGTEAVEPAAAAQIQRSPFMPGIDSPALSLLSFTQQLRSAEYLAYLAFFIACIIRFNYYISSVGSQLDAMGQTEDATYSTAFGLILPCGLFFNLGLGWALDRYGPVLGLTFVWLLAVLLSALSMVPVLPLQVVTFIVFTLFRGLNFCVMTVFISAVFSFQPLGSLVGMLTAVAGVIGLCNSALLAWALDTPDGVPNFQPVNAFLLAVMLACGLFPIWLARRAGLGSLLSALARGGKPA